MAEAAAVIGAMVGTLAGGGGEEIPTATQSNSKSPGAGAPPLEYRRRSSGWETFNCSCGKLLQLSPAFSAHSLNCRKCGRVIKIDPA
jgi:hypothetical protein